MNPSLNEYLRLASPYLHPSLISPEALGHIQQIGRLLPPVSASGFECRLGDPAPRADLGVRFLPSEGGPAMLAGHGPDYGPDYRTGYGPDHGAGQMGLPGYFLEHPVWQRLGDFGASWGEPGTLLHQEIEDIFLEFDVDGTPHGVPVPAFFLDFKKSARQRLDALQQALAILWGQALSEPVRRTLQRCLVALPSGAVLYSVGAMFSRRFDGVRLYIHHMSPGAMPGFLASFGWAGSTSELEALLAWLPARLTLCIDVGETVLPRVGVQYHIDENLKSSTPKWAAFFNLLVARGLCLPGKRDALLAWIGHVHMRSNPDAWPEHLRRRARDLGPNVLGVFLRMINHIKISYEAGQAPEAKAYLGFLETWLGYDAAARRYVLGELPGPASSQSPQSGRVPAQLEPA